MKLLIDIGHPAHVHLFRFLAKRLLSEGHEVLFTLREKEFEKELLTAYGFEFRSFGKKYNSLSGKLAGMLKFGLMETRTALTFRPDMFISHGSIYASHAAALLGKPHIALEDTGNWEQVSLYLPFTKAVISPDTIKTKIGKNHILYPGYHELAYLHPRYFTPDPAVFSLLGIPDYSPYAIIRFIGWNATHDVGKKGINQELKRELIARLSRQMKVFVSSEVQADKEFEPYLFRLPPERMHDALAFASIYAGEGTTMAVEAAVSGTPAFYVSNVESGNCEELEAYGLMYTITDGDQLLKRIDEVLSIPDYKIRWSERREKLLENKIDLTSFLFWFVTNYPESKNLLKNNPRHILQFHDAGRQSGVETKAIY